MSERGDCSEVSSAYTGRQEDLQDVVRQIGIGLAFGAGAGVLDVIPMIGQNLTWDANLSAFTMWVVIGFFIAVVKLPMPSPFQGILTAFLCLAPAAFLIGWKEPFALVPIAAMTTILGAGLGYVIRRFGGGGFPSEET